MRPNARSFEGIVGLTTSIYSSSTRLKGSPRSPLYNLRSRGSLELVGRRIISGATRIPDSRQARRPLSQSSQLITSFMGIVGTPDLESFGLFIDQSFPMPLPLPSVRVMPNANKLEHGTPAPKSRIARTGSVGRARSPNRPSTDKKNGSNDGRFGETAVPGLHRKLGPYAAPRELKSL